MLALYFTILCDKLDRLTLLSKKAASPGGAFLQCLTQRKAPSFTVKIWLGWKYEPL